MKYGIHSVGAILFVGLLFLPNNLLSPPISPCFEKENPAQCYDTYFDDLLTDSGVVPALDALASLYLVDARFPRFCHTNTHDIGRAAYRVFAADRRADITMKASYCGFGYYHGFMEEMFKESGTLADSKEFCRLVGEKLGGEQAYAEGACYHGIGHGVTEEPDPSQWGDAEALTRPGLELCRSISDTDEWLMRCASGVYNSLAIMYRDPLYELTVPEDLFEVCHDTTLLKPERKSCYSQMNTLVAHYAKQDPRAAFKYTESIQEPQFRREAIVSIAAMPEQWRLVGIGESVSVCREVVPFTKNCIRGVVAGMMEFGLPGKEADKAFEYCSNEQLLPEERQACMNEIVVMAQGMFPKDRLKQLCTRFPDDYMPSECKNVLASTY